jgi:Flp pilus assembly protein CpaB
VQTGDHVDILASYTSTSSGTGQGRAVVKTLLQDKLVLRAGGQPSNGGSEGNDAEKSIIVRASDQEAVSLAHAADNGKLWVLLRPAAEAKQSKPQTATLDSILAGTKGPAKFKTTIKKNGNTVTVTGGSTR